MTEIKSPAEMRKLAEALGNERWVANGYHVFGDWKASGSQASVRGDAKGFARAAFVAAANPAQITHMANLIEAQARRIEEVQGVLAGLEAACDALAATRSRETYIRMLDVDLAGDQLQALDKARAHARALLSTQGAS